MKKMSALLLAVVMLALCACGGTTSSSAPAEESGSEEQETQYDYQLKAGEPMEVYDVTFDKMVTVTVDPASTRNGEYELRSDIHFDNCVFNGGLTIVGDYHAMISLGADCSFGEGAVVTCKEATPGAAKEMTLDDNFVKVLVSCEGVAVETENAFGLVSGGPDAALNGTTYSKAELAPDTDFLGVYCTYDGDALTYTKLGIGEDDSVVFLD